MIKETMEKSIVFLYTSTEQMKLKIKKKKHLYNIAQNEILRYKYIQIWAKYILRKL